MPRNVQPVREPDPLHVADAAVVLARQSAAERFTKLGHVVLAACAATTDAQRVDALRRGLLTVRAGELLAARAEERLAASEARERGR